MRKWLIGAGAAALLLAVIVIVILSSRSSLRLFLSPGNRDSLQRPGQPVVAPVMATKDSLNVNGIMFVLGNMRPPEGVVVNEEEGVLVASRSGTVLLCDTLLYNARMDTADLDADGTTEILVEDFSGGAHCCYTLRIFGTEEGAVVVSNPLDLGHSEYALSDAEGGVKNIICRDPAFAYVFTSFAASRMPLVVYRYRHGRLVRAREEASQVYLTDIRMLEDDFRQTVGELPGGRIDCSDTLSTGDVKSIIAALVADYDGMRKPDLGWEQLDALYPCPDRELFRRQVQALLK